jgi:hypothetical protein
MQLTSVGIPATKETSMRFYTKTHKHYCGIDLHARSRRVGRVHLFKLGEPKIAADTLSPIDSGRPHKC